MSRKLIIQEGEGLPGLFGAGLAPLDSPEAEVLEWPPDREAGAADPDRLQHAGVSELVQDQRLVKLVRHLEAEGHMTVRRETFRILQSVYTDTHSCPFSQKLNYSVWLDQSASSGEKEEELQPETGSSCC